IGSYCWLHKSSKNILTFAEKAHCIEDCRDPDNLNGLASSLVRVPHSWSKTGLANLTKSGRQHLFSQKINMYMKRTQY
ncbi:MAG: hypothetical protein ACK53Y_08840, partial [bacterium]